MIIIISCGICGKLYSVGNVACSLSLCLHVALSLTWQYLHDLTLFERRKKRQVVLSSTLPFMSPHLATVPLRPAPPHQIEAPRHPLYPWGGGWLSHMAHLPCCFYYDSHLFLPHRRLSLVTWQSRSKGVMTPVFTVNGWRDIYSPLHTREFTCMAKGYSGIIDVPVGVMTQQLELTHCEKVCSCVGAHNISNLWSLLFMKEKKYFYLRLTPSCTTKLPVLLSSDWTF